MTLCSINRNTGESVYRQICRILEQEIKSAYEAGDYLPVEVELAARFSVNRHTLRRAIDELVSMGLVERQHGRGNLILGEALEYKVGEKTFDLGLPIKLYGHYATNNDANGVNDGEDTAWLLGVETKMGRWKASYDYRETELNAVNGAFNDSNFAGGRTDSEGNRWKLSYKIDKNFSVGTTYIDSEVGQLNGDLDSDIWQIDLKAKF
ncbi:putative porin [Cycloclasticus zancles]|jgi:DNA-binding transcriptional regulator YhcF (GntR family)|uniref:Transcriptional regulator, GntR family n=1 Tax=Cycloclasticus zancles 78-ME TaxID=1198232 RepID=S5TAN4_9GAMM|nr:putative porin [Cycloclasticus zancles]AGS40664.1 Transcriptional regulator, GntR family [Cycloclasticus zancles 78-ME]